MKLDLNLQATESLLVNYIQEYTQQSGFANLVIGLSGGLDSSVAVTLAVAALGKNHVIGFSLPYLDMAETEDAEELAYKLGIAYTVEYIDRAVYAIEETLSDIQLDIKYDDNEYQLCRGNICARTRMIFLYDLSKTYNALVLGTGNKSEYYLGYTTIWGDMACSFNPLGDLYKTQVRALAKHIGVSSAIIEKAPSAGLWDGQTDEGELGFTYAEADAILSILIDSGLAEDTAIEALLAQGIKQKIIDTVLARVKATEFKRRMPDYKSLTNNCFIPDLFNGAF